MLGYSNQIKIMRIKMKMKTGGRDEGNYSLFGHINRFCMYAVLGVAVVAVSSIILRAAVFRVEISEVSGAGNLAALAGKWKPVDGSLNLLDEDLVSSGDTGLEISIDEKLGDSHRKASKDYYEQYSAFLLENGHTPMATGFIRFDYGGEGEIVISRKEGSLYLWHGVVTGGNPRIFPGMGAEKDAVETLVIEWAHWCSYSPVDNDRDFATVIYKRDGHEKAIGLER